MVLLSKAVLMFFSFYGISCFNISPNPNIILIDPLENDTHSSYFGYAINLRKKSVLVGAPKANINETGEIFKCEITDLKVSNCYRYEFKNKIILKNHKKTDLTNEINEYQMLGSAMDGFGSENDKFVVCAPNLKNVYENDYYLNGGCYMIQNSNENETSNIKDILLTNKIKEQKIFKKKYRFHHKLAQQGFSVHVTEYSSEIIIGAPGIYVWSGNLKFIINFILIEHNFIYFRITYSISWRK